MGAHNICLYKEVDKKYTGYNLKTMELLDCALIGVCAVIRSNMVLKVDTICKMPRFCSSSASTQSHQCLFSTDTFYFTLYCIHPKISNTLFLTFCLNFAFIQLLLKILCRMTKSVDPDQTAPSGAV